MKRKWLAVGIILVFIGVAIVPSINFNIVRASEDNDFVEVTTQAIGVDGYANTTVKLTREQYAEVVKLFDDVAVELHTLKTRADAVPIYTNAIVRLNTYGLLPQGMSVTQAQRLVLDSHENVQGKSTIPRVCDNTLHPMQHNYFFCLVSGVVQDGTAMGILYMIGLIMLLLSVFPSPFHINTVLFGLIGLILTVTSYIFVTISPLAILQQINILSGNLTLVGPGGSLHFNEGLLNGFTGIKITRIGTREMYLLGCSLMVSAYWSTI
jgi:hypothetical protein